MDSVSPSLRRKKFKILKFGEVENYHYQKQRDLDPLAPTTKVNTVVPIDVHNAILDKKDQDHNAYSTSKSYSQNILNTAVMQSQIFTLVNLSAAYTGKGPEIALISLLAISLGLQLLIFILLVLLAKAKQEQLTQSITATDLNAFITSLTFFLLIITTAITGVSKIAGITGILTPNITST